ncbi:GNAT family N-acetyltransferase [Methylophaga sp. OBS4]|uniref:GNAT family N-acetyltransferase n=1 Tax=Methylophaga sp. OBS4 TaxID=2991935 RepID=UPI00225A491D|nr:GNAT family N-acetyltransferase [Methylophaga sp. OBS4]MCX4188006.1 GNAT family N-acetyltransferase [Methylophaga sp. OBS4]
MAADNFTIRTMTRDDLNIAVNWAAAEGWNPGLYDADTYYTADPSGFFIGEIGNKPVATISAVKYGGRFGFLGFFIVSPAYRGNGYGRQIWHTAIDYLGGMNIGLDGVVAQQENYKKFGFKLAHRNMRYEGLSGGELPDNVNLVKLADLPFDIVASYDRAFFPADRSTFIEHWINQPESQALGIMQDDQLTAYGVIRKCLRGYKIGPLFADTPELAEQLFLALKASVTPAEPVYLDVPAINTQAVALAQRHHMTIMFETARMYTMELPDISLNRTFGVTSFELG